MLTADFVLTLYSRFST